MKNFIDGKKNISLENITWSEMGKETAAQLKRYIVPVTANVNPI